MLEIVWHCNCDSLIEDDRTNTLYKVVKLEKLGKLVVHP
jgi:hypothetical protein